MLRRLVYLTCLILAYFSYSLSQGSGKIAGFVRDVDTKEPLPGVNVVIKGTTLGAATDYNGYYIILNVPPGVYELTASMVGYQKVTQTNVIVNAERTTHVDFYLKQEVIQLGTEVIVEAKRPDVIPDNTSTIEFIKAVNMAEVSPGVRNIEDILGFLPEISDGHFRGGRLGEESYTLGGIRIVNPINNTVAFSPIMSAIEEVQVITSGFGAQYGNAQSGVVNMFVKEGNRERWEGRVEFRFRLPGYKHWGGSVFDEFSNPYLQVLNSIEKWKGINPVTDRIFYDFIAYGFSSVYKDTTQAATIAYLLWKQARRDLNKNYNNLWDRSIDISLGGPILKNGRIFLAFRTEREWPVIPTFEPMKTQKFMGNFSFDFPRGINLQFYFSGSVENEFSFRGWNSESYTGIRDWLWDRIIGVSPNLSQSILYGIKFTKALSSKSFYDVKIGWLKTKFEQGANVLDPNRYTEEIANRGMWRHFNTPDLFSVGDPDNDFIDEKTETLTFDVNLTSQITNTHMLTSGVQFNLYNINVNNRLNLSSPSAAAFEMYSAKPYEFGIYFQDKMEFQYMIANVGLRLDGYNYNIDYYLDKFSPIRNKNFNPLEPPVGSNRYYAPELAAKGKTKLILKLQPRFGLSFPISVNTVFYLNYISAAQRPPFNRTIHQRVSQQGGFPILLGNPELKPEETRSYEVGLVQALGEGFTFELGGYYKDVKNLVETAYYIDEQQTLYQTYINRDYADIKGFRISLNKKYGYISGFIKYNYSVATGKSSNPFDAPVVYREKPGEGEEPITLPDPRDILMDFDRTHNLVIQLSIRTPEAWGIKVFDKHILGDWLVTIKSFARSGRPYTYDESGLGLKFNKRAPAEYSTDIRLAKSLGKVFGVNNLTFYIEVFNLFNQKIYNYNTVFRNVQNVVKYEKNRDGLRWLDTDPPFLMDQTFLIYSNQPRAIYLGLIFKI
jgi:outer membrane receptor protein involved in Fe transport